MTDAARPGYADAKPALVTRLRQIEGQVRESSRCSSDERYCIDVLAQIAAARTALERGRARGPSGARHHCVHGAIASGDSAAATVKSRELLEPVARFVKTR